MANAVSPSEVLSLGQIAKLADLISAGLRKAGLPGDVSQWVIEREGEAITKEFVASFCRRVEAKAKEIVRRVKVNRTRSPQEALVATGRRLFVNDDVAKSMPKGVGEEVEVVFFTLDRHVSVSDLEQEYEKRGLKPADICSLAAVNEADPAFADEKPNGTQWKDDKDNYYCAAFNRWRVERAVDVDRHGRDWLGSWWFAGLRK